MVFILNLCKDAIFLYVAYLIYRKMKQLVTIRDNKDE